MAKQVCCVLSEERVGCGGGERIRRSRVDLQFRFPTMVKARVWLFEQFPKVIRGERDGDGGILCAEKGGRGEGAAV